MAMILSAFIPNFVHILSQMVRDEVINLLGVPREIDKLTRMVSQVQSVLLDAEMKQTESVAVKLWVMQLKDVMYDAEDVIDLCRIKADEQHARFRSSIFSDTNCAIYLLSCFYNPTFAHEIALKIKELNSRMDLIVKNIPLLGLIEHKNSPSQYRRVACNINRRTSPVVVPSDLVGEKIEEDTNNIVELLIKETTRVQGTIPVVSIVGMGGIGKTTLAKLVYNDQRIKEEFELLIWICVSKEFRPVDILKNVIREVGGVCGEAVEISELVPKLKQHVKGTKFLLILDDVWSENEGVWHGLLREPMMNGTLGSSVLITTRDRGVALRMKATRCYSITGLSDEDGWSLLVKQVVQSETERDEVQDLKDIGMQIVKKCEGLPLAIKSIGGMLCMKGKSRFEWQSVLKSSVWSIDGMLGDVHHAFHLSFEDLSAPLKQCFIFCSLFPEDYLYRENQLIYLWLAEGFLRDQGDIWELGTGYYKELLLRNFLEDTGKYYNQSESKMHDLLWSFARQLGKDENIILREGEAIYRPEYSLKLRRISIEGKQINNEIIRKEKWSRTLFLHEKPQVALNDLYKFVSKLRILDLSRCHILMLSDYISELVHLRYLDLTGSSIRTIPISIGNLKNLVYLNCRSCKHLSHVPDSITNLRELRYLNFSNTNVKALPMGLINLDKLIELCGFKQNKNIFKEFASLIELETLSLLVNLQMQNLENISDKYFAERAILHSKARLQFLSLEYTSLSSETQVSLGDVEKYTCLNVLNELSPPPSLQQLKIAGYFGRCLPNWLNVGATLPNLRLLEISDCACFDKMASLGQLPNLDFLRINRAYSVVTVAEEFFWPYGKHRDLGSMSCSTMPAFPKLAVLIFEGMPNWKDWQWKKEWPAMPKLKRLKIKTCPLLKTLPEGLAHHATSLEVLQIIGDDNLISIENLSSIKEIRVLQNTKLLTISNLPNITFIRIRDCPNLKVLQNFEGIRKMELNDLNMETLPEYLMETRPQMLTIWCSVGLLLKIANQEKGGSEWAKFKHIYKVNIYTDNDSLYAAYQMVPFSFITNIGTLAHKVDLEFMMTTKECCNNY